jgi:hypothetical protein
MQYARDRQSIYKLLIEKFKGIDYFSDLGVNCRTILN